MDGLFSTLASPALYATHTRCNEYIVRRLFVLRLDSVISVRSLLNKTTLSAGLQACILNTDYSTSTYARTRRVVTGEYLQIKEDTYSDFFENTFTCLASSNLK